jgi:pimeloyl-ACP methyl ester carboxylesterase
VGSPPQEHRLRANGVELTCFEWHRELRGRQPPILLVHATGFHARVWDPVVERLGERHVISVDQRGHGRSEKTAITHWEVFGRDLAALVRELGLRDVLGPWWTRRPRSPTASAGWCSSIP